MNALYCIYSKFTIAIAVILEILFFNEVLCRPSLLFNLCIVFGAASLGGVWAVWRNDRMNGASEQAIISATKLMVLFLSC